MALGTSLPADMSDCDSRSVAKDASPLPSGTPGRPPYPPLSSSFMNSRGGEPDRFKDVELHPTASNTNLGQFSFAPATRTTVVTTTTTTTTSFPPLIFKAPRSIRELDPKIYPLASSPTPASLRNIQFELGGRPVIFNEPEDAASAFQEYKEKHEALKASNGLLRSVTACGLSTENALPRHSDGAELFRHSPNNPLISKRRPMSPVSITEVAKSSRRTRSSMAPSDPRTRRSQGQSRLERTKLRHSSAVGLATPETENIQFQLKESVVPRRKIHGAKFSSEDNLCLPMSRGTDKDALPVMGLKRHLEKENQQSSAIVNKRLPFSECRNFTSSEKHACQVPKSTARGDDAVGSAECDPDKIDEQSTDATLEDPTSVASSVTDVESSDAQDTCLPSPSLSPITAMIAQNPDPLFDLTEDREIDIDSSFENRVPQLPKDLHLGDVHPRSSGVLTSDQARSTFDGAAVSSTSLMDIPVMLDYFDSVPDEMKTYLMYQLLRRCPKATLQFVADVVNPALKCDFLALLPPELSLNIVKYFDVQTMCRAAQVSKRWRHIINSDEKTWKELFERDGYVLPEGELQRAIREGWGWQYPNGKDDWEKDLSTSTARKSDFDDSVALNPPPPGVSTDGNGFAPSPCPRRLKRKAPVGLPGRKSAKRKAPFIEGDTSDIIDWKKDIATIEGPYAAANAAVVAVPYPEVGLPALRSLHLYKSLYQRHYLIRKAWMLPSVKPKHIAFRAHDRHVVTCLQFDTDKILTGSGSDDTNINVYDTKTGALRATLAGHNGGVWALEYYGNTLVSGSTDRTVRVWDIERAKCTQIFHGHTSTVRCLQILLPMEVGKRADGSSEMMPKVPLIITGSRDSNLRVWKLPQPGDPVYLQSGLHANDTSCPYFVRVLAGHHHSVRAIAAHGDTLVSGSYDCSVRVWKISTGETIHRFQGHTFKVYSVVLDHHRNRCISGSMDNMVKVWSLESGSLLYNLEGHSSLVGLLDLKDDRLVSAAADSTLRIWDPETGQCKRTLSAHTGAITCFQHDGQKVISGSDRTLKMWNVQTGECVKDLLTDLSGVWQVRFNDRRCVAAVQRNSLTYIEVLDFGASRDGVPEHRLGKRIVVDHQGCEADEVAREIDYEASGD